MEPVPSTAEASVGDVEPVSWTSHPMRRRPLVGVLVLVMVAAFAVLASHAAFGGMPTATGIVAFVLFASVARFYLPTRFELRGTGLTTRILGLGRELPWERVRAMELGGRAARLFTRSRRGWLAKLGSVLVPLEDAPEAAVRILKERKATLEHREGPIDRRAGSSSEAEESRDEGSR